MVGRLIGVREFANFANEALADLDDGIDTKASLLGKCGGGFVVVNAGIKDVALDRGEGDVSRTDAFKDGFKGCDLDLSLDFGGDIGVGVWDVFEWGGVGVWEVARFAVGINRHGVDDGTEEGAKTGAIGLVTGLLEEANKAQEDLLCAVGDVVCGDAF